MPPSPRDITVAPPQSAPSLHPWFGPWLGDGLVPWVDSIAAGVGEVRSYDGTAAPGLVASDLLLRPMWSGVVGPWADSPGGGLRVRATFEVRVNVTPGQQFYGELRAFGVPIASGWDVLGAQRWVIQAEGVQPGAGLLTFPGLMWGNSPGGVVISSVVQFGFPVGAPIPLELHGQFSALGVDEVALWSVRAERLAPGVPF